MSMTSPLTTGIPFSATWASDPSALPSQFGSYLILAELSETVSLPERFAGTVLLPGTYLYAGSANGPGGIRARVSRHFRREKKLHWHADWLTTKATSLHAAPFSEKSECQLVEELLKAENVHHPVMGFGSSDCTKCDSHLVRL